MSRIVTVTVVACVMAGVVAASIGERLLGVALLILGTCVFGFRRKFYFLAAIEEGGIPDSVSSNSTSDYSDGHHSSHTSDSDSGGGGDTD